MNAILTKTLATVAAVGAFAVAALPASAGQVWNRVENQQDRIQQGVRSGQLTRGEYSRDEAHLRAINAQRRADLRRNDGHLTPAEQARLNRELNRDSNRIYFTKHNRADQPGV
jgi:hypothetical protein